MYQMLLLGLQEHAASSMHNCFWLVKAIVSRPPNMTGGGLLLTLPVVPELNKIQMG